MRKNPKLMLQMVPDPLMDGSFEENNIPTTAAGTTPNTSIMGSV